MQILRKYSRARQLIANSLNKEKNIYLLLSYLNEQKRGSLREVEHLCELAPRAKVYISTFEFFQTSFSVGA